MNVIKKSREFSTLELYKLIKDPETDSLKKHVGETLEVTGYVLREEDDGRTVLTLELSEGPATGSNSATVQQSFEDILAIYESCGNPNSFPLLLDVFSKTAEKSGRPYINIRLVGEG